jgi:hypothetical protein
MLSFSRPRPFSLPLFFLVLTPFMWPGQASGQKFNRLDLSINALGQFTGSSSGNGVVDDPSSSAGGLASVRQSFHPWLGYEINWSYTRFTEQYSSFPFGVQNNVMEFTGAYLFQAPKLILVQPFAAVGTGALFFLPTTSGGQQSSLQTRMPLLYELGLNWPILTEHFGARLEYRDFVYRTPDFNRAMFKTGATRQTSEPAAGIYVRF